MTNETVDVNSALEKAIRADNELTYELTQWTKTANAALRTVRRESSLLREAMQARVAAMCPECGKRYKQRLGAAGFCFSCLFKFQQ